MSAVFAVFTAVYPIPEDWKRALGALAGAALALSCAGWLCAHSATTRKLRRRKGRRPMTLIIVFVAGGLISVLFWSLVPKTSKNAEEPDKRKNADLERRYLGELDDPVERVYLLLRLSETNPFAALQPFEIIFTAVKQGRGFSLRAIGKTNTTETVGENATIVSAYELTTAEIAPEGNKVAFRQSFIPRDKEIKGEGLPIAAWALAGKPFLKIRDFHNSSAEILLSQPLRNKVEVLGLCVNGWVILKAETKRRGFRVGSPNDPPFSSSTEMYTLLSESKPDRPPVARWRVDVHQAIPDYKPEGAGPVPVQEKVEMWMPGQIRGQIRIGNKQ